MGEPFPSFPAGFVWGAATAAYQIEGAVTEGGRGPSIWDTFSHTPGRIDGDDTGDVACDHYHRYEEDVALLRGLGVGAYRFSVAWPRVQPDGRGHVNPGGLAFYGRLVDELLDAGITPVATLYHWDLPQALEDTGGWRSRDTAHRFADYAADVHAALGDRVKMWITLNEPYCSAFVGYAEGRHAPGAREGVGALAAAHHLMLGHGLAVQALAAQRRGDDQVGITLNLNDVRPVSTSPADRAAARRAACLQNLVFSDPILAGRYPECEAETWAWLASDLPFRRDGDLETIASPIDFLGVNTYFPIFAAAGRHDEPDSAARAASDVAVDLVPPASLHRSAMGWPIDPTIMSALLDWLHAQYPGLPPIYITENGAAFDDVPDAGGQVHDDDRIRYLDGHLRDLHAAISAGADVRGYFCWSLMDNFEWACGYGKRFGLVHVDYPTQTRRPKDSYAWYRDVVIAAEPAPTP
ncbi:MAG TPA: GH1 family beta-glucosidase [Kineosporiaceae bacterium]|nr:GH1 family beta-glucosidase [Kineosporiaceae bacterium]